MTSRAVLTMLIIAQGIASQYAPGVMERVIEYRQTSPVAYALPGELPDVAGFVAVLDCSEIGNVWTLRINGGAPERFLVADCAGDAATREWMTRGGVLVEVDHETAERLGFVGRAAHVERVRYVERVEAE